MMLYPRRNCEPVVECVSIGDKKAAVPVNIPAGTVELFPGANQDFKATHIRLSAASAVEPEVELDYDLTTGEVRRLFQPAVGGKGQRYPGCVLYAIRVSFFRSADAPNMPSFTAKHYVCHRQFVPSSDGVKVPVTLVHRDGLHMNGKSVRLAALLQPVNPDAPPVFSETRRCCLCTARTATI
jgi:protease II